MSGAARNVRLYPWFKFFQNLMFWQAIWFLFFQSELSAAQAILIFVFADIATTVFEVPSGFLSDRIGRRITLIFSVVAGLVAAVMQAFGSEFWVFAAAQVALGIHFAFISGTDSSFLYESLAKDGREDEVEEHELRAWRFSFVALAISAVAGGVMALWGLRVPYFATAASFVALLIVVLYFVEPARDASKEGSQAHWTQALGTALKTPVLIWLFALSTLMYGFSHLPFVFGQPFIFAALDGLGLSANAPLVSGVVTALMMLLSVLTSWLAPGIRKRIGLSGILLLAFGMQIALVGGLAVTSSVYAIAFLLMRMVPDSFSRPFILARIQPLLEDQVRATYLSIQNLSAKLLFALSLYFAAGGASDVGVMANSEIQTILTVYAGIGLMAFAALYFTARGREV